MSNPAAQAAAQHLARHRDEVVRAAVVKRLGDDGWPADLLDRLRVIRGPDGETYYLDDEPLIWIGPPRVTHDETTGAISVDRAWKDL